MIRLLVICALACASPLIVGGCVPVNTASTITISVDKGFLVAVTSFVEVKRLALAGIKSGVITGDTKARVIALANKGQAIEDRLYATRSAADILALTNVVAELSSLSGGPK